MEHAKRSNSSAATDHRPPILRGLQVTDVACMHRAARRRSRQTHLRMSRMPEHDGADREVSCARKAAKGSEPALTSQIRTYKAGSPDASGVRGLGYFLGAPLQARAPPRLGRLSKAFLCPLRSFFPRSGRNRRRTHDRSWSPTMLSSAVPFPEATSSVRTPFKN